MQRNFPVLQSKNNQPLLEKDLTDKIIGAAIEVHKVLGPGLLESAYQTCMEHESTLRNIPFERLADLPLNYKGLDLDAGYVIDLVYDKRVIVELKAVERVIPVHEAHIDLYETHWDSCWPSAQLQCASSERRHLSTNSLMEDGASIKNSASQ